MSGILACVKCMRFIAMLYQLMSSLINRTRGKVWKCIKIAPTSIVAIWKVVNNVDMEPLCILPLKKEEES